MAATELPEQWAEASVLDLASLIRGVSYAKGEALSSPTDGHVALLRANNIGDGLNFLDLQYVPQGRVSQEQMIQTGDVVLAMSSGSKQVVGKAASARGKWNGTFGAFCGVLRPHWQVDPAFFGYYFQTKGYRDAISAASSGTNINNLKREYFEAIVVPLPPLAEQKRIVARVEELLALVNAARERLAKVPRILKRFRQSVLAAACSGRLTEDWRAAGSVSESARALLERILLNRKDRYLRQTQECEKEGLRKPRQPKCLSASEISNEPFSLPESWLWVTWDDLTDWITYGFTRPMPHVAEGIPVVTAKNVLHDFVDLMSADRTSLEAFESLNDKDRPEAGEILLTKDGTLGRAAIVQKGQRCCINQSVAVLRFGGLSANERYLLRVIQCPFTQNLIEEGAKGAAMPHISITTFGSFPVPLPPLDEQKEIVRRVEALFKLADQIEQRVAAATKRADKLTQAILAKAFRGELVPTEAELARQENRSYEPASALLGRIRSQREQPKPTGARAKSTRKTKG
ncbi:MAG: restriction endonuclease subunit S [Planctomycetaceae bacterium]|nr:restriction endonuclease subunit S [Planctomycetaceae bacterium]